MGMLVVAIMPTPQPRPKRRDKISAMTNFCFNFVAKDFSPAGWSDMSFLRRSDVKMMRKTTQLKM